MPRAAYPSLYLNFEDDWQTVIYGTFVYDIVFCGDTELKTEVQALVWKARNTRTERTSISFACLNIHFMTENSFPIH